jgi:hypothetical protein
MLNGVKLLLQEATTIPLHERVYINNGTVKASEIPRDQLPQPFCSYAFIPKMEWRQLTNTELGLLCSDDYHLPEGEWLSIMNIPAEIMAYFRDVQILAQVVNYPDEVRQQANTELLGQGFVLLENYLCKLDDLAGSTFHTSAIATNPPNLITTAYDNQNHGYVGLHVDSFYGKDALYRNDSPNRISINIGPEDRYFMFMNLTMPQIYERMGHPVSGEVNELIRLFMAAHPDYPVIRVRLAPGEAYVAPSETLIHDGSTVHKKYMDLNLHILGRYRARIE